MLPNRRFIASLSLFVLFNLILLCISGCGVSEFRARSSHTTFIDEQIVTPSVAKVIPKADTLHGDVRIDNYYWLRDRSNLDVIEYIEAENEYIEAMMKHTEEFQEQLYKELLGRIKETDLSVPEKNR